MNIIDIILSIILHTSASTEAMVSPAPPVSHSAPAKVEDSPSEDDTIPGDDEGAEVWNDGNPVVCDEGWTFIEDGDQDYCEAPTSEVEGPAYSEVAPF